MARQKKKKKNRGSLSYVCLRAYPSLIGYSSQCPSCRDSLLTGEAVAVSYCMRKLLCLSDLWQMFSCGVWQVLLASRRWAGRWPQGEHMLWPGHFLNMTSRCCSCCYSELWNFHVLLMQSNQNISGSFPAVSSLRQLSHRGCEWGHTPDSVICAPVCSMKYLKKTYKHINQSLNTYPPPRPKLDSGHYSTTHSSLILLLQTLAPVAYMRVLNQMILCT